MPKPTAKRFVTTTTVAAVVGTRLDYAVCGGARARSSATLGDNLRVCSVANLLMNESNRVGVRALPYGQHAAGLQSAAATWPAPVVIYLGS